MLLHDLAQLSLGGEDVLDVQPVVVSIQLEYGLILARAQWSTLYTVSTDIGLGKVSGMQGPVAL